MIIKVKDHEQFEVSVNTVEIDRSEISKIFNNSLIKNFSYDPVECVNLFYGLREHFTKSIVNIDKHAVKLQYKVLKLYKNNIETYGCICCPICNIKANVAVLETGPKYNHLRFVNIEKNTCFNIDHIVEKYRGGSSHIDNLRIMCRDCNSNRSNLATGILAEPLEVALQKIYLDFGNKTNSKSRLKTKRKQWNARALEFIEQNNIQSIKPGQILLIKKTNYIVIERMNQLVCCPKNGSSFIPSEVQAKLLNYFCSIQEK